jgi:predicted PurR-regulated permease PerM
MAAFPRNRLERSTFLVLFALAAYGVWRTLEPVWVPVLLGMVLAVGVYPLQERILRRTGGTHAGWLAALLTAAVMALLLSVIAFLLLVVGGRAVNLAHDIAARYQAQGEKGLLGEELSAFLARVGVQPATLGARLAGAARDLAAWAGGAATRILAGFFSALFTVLFTAVTSFYLLREGADSTTWLVEMLPLSDGQVRQIVRDVRDVTRAILLSTGLMTLYQSVASGVGYWIFGVDSPLVWASLTGVASILPAVGTALVWVPICIVLAFTGHAGKAAGLLCWSAVLVVFVADYILRPKVVGTRIKMSDLLVFIAIFGGIEAFGVMGLVLGPIAVAVLLSLLRIYQRDYRPEGPAHTPDVAAQEGDPEHPAH